ncbi:hypothetical protein B296_00005734 [Ensete ventricosum]|uniref:Uncharacterized protein n=1 Tax=Ensete ventricosum TaxID=4639 RepID=A0A427A6V5_ENSVE|nr:hypothetical protein B296_00005734 [Ensete ventricosum]
MGAKKPVAVVVGGSIAGLSCAHALISAGWRATVIEKTAGPPSGSPTGAGLGLDPESLRLVCRWTSDPNFLHAATVPLSIDINRATDSKRKVSRTLTRDEGFNFRAAHWADLHSILLQALPPGTVVWGHQFLSFDVSNDKSFVVTKSRVLPTDEVVEIAGDLLVAADGCLSSIRRHFLPNFKLRYSGYTAWRGILDFTGKESSDIIVGVRRAYPELGDCLYFDLATGTHCVLYELKGKRLNWLWYMNGPEPEHKTDSRSFQGSSVTIKASNDMIQKMHEEAEKVWVPELSRIMKETEEPFVNIIYDSDPLPRLFWDNVVLIGDAAHPTTPHGLRSTNMSIQDVGILGYCLEKWGLEHLSMALEEFQRIRLPVVSKQVLHSRKLGRPKQGLVVNGQETFDPMTATPEECLQLQQRRIPYFEGKPCTI